MEKLSTAKYLHLINASIARFWQTRNSQSIGQKTKDQGSRSAVTGGKQLDGFIELLATIAKDLGIPDDYIHTRRNYLPGFFRPSKNWDLLNNFSKETSYCCRGIQITSWFLWKQF